MAFIEIKWTKTESINIGEYASCFIFNSSTIDLLSLSADRRDWIEKEILSCLLEELDATWEKHQWDTTLSKVHKGVYVVTLADNICIQYERGYSQVVYIGKGQIRDKIKNHIKHWFTQITKSMQDIKFRIWMTEIKVRGSPNAFKDVEADLIEVFEKEYGDLPIQNSKGGNYHKKDHHYNAEWKLPLKVDPSINYGWCIVPMVDNEWFSVMEE